jgi:hypothetical protein
MSGMVVLLGPDKEGEIAVSRVVHCRKEPYDVYIGRPSKWGNPFSHKEGTSAQFRVATREEAVAKYEVWLMAMPRLLAELHELEGKTLGCWCKPQACHGDILLKLLEQRRTADTMGNEGEQDDG